VLSRISPFGKQRSRASLEQRAYAIGDIHGRLDLLDDLLDRIEADNATRCDANVTLVFLGDLIDRGPQSAQVIERLRRYRPSFAKTVFLMGNHEEVLLRILAGETEVFDDWLRFGGAECARSYGVDPLDLQARSGPAAVRALRDSIPKVHLKFLSSFVDTATFGGYLFVHAGIRPGVPLSHQVPDDLRWIRAPFLTNEADHGRIVVHGHTISEKVEVRSNRIGIDTGAYRTDVLTALGVEAENHWILQTQAKPSPSAGTARVAKFQHA